MSKITTVDQLVERFGGLFAMQRALGYKHPTIISQWKKRGRIPNWRKRDILEAAEAKDVRVTSKDLDRLISA